MYTIGQVSEMFGLPISTLRYYDKMCIRDRRKHHPELWEKLMELDRRALAQFGTGPLGQFKQNWSVERLDERFAKEDGQTA